MPKPATFDDCLADATPQQRAALEKVCKAIRAAAPDAEEGVSYGMAAFRLNGKPIAGLSASKDHCSYFPMSGKVVAALKDDLEDYDTSKGTIRFLANKPLPAALVRKLVKARIAEIAPTARKPTKARGRR
jgi:uncharacterized protein YdhG (YjbR/CyaY superfamily)